MAHSIAARLYLLCYDLDRQRMTGRDRIGLLTSAAALTELYLSGHLIDQHGKPAPGAAWDATDPVLGEVLTLVAGAPGRRWKHWVRRQAKPTHLGVRTRLAEERVIGVRHSKLLGVFPHTTITIRDRRLAKQVRADLNRALREPLSRVTSADAALVALAATIEVRAVLPARVRREHKVRIRQFVDDSGPAVAALRSLIKEKAASAGG
ncbi:GOLPH3/VPS74 family protein [Labedaea rhizosphaerae]|uniref:Golgi phosphoprotein 3 GPP34 n=1 Tax=Labedaea rhizosphaerae TaxID=598644 RepID=A0A4R6SMQ5_LABRH|nr:GPP34 family phosphoprotein [Labedaea rhizosphaerae]TDQ04453.1 Golgi phosphoprotein 3 GPP34 [Labedaea rhizosphaerae]